MTPGFFSNLKIDIEMTRPKIRKPARIRFNSLVQDLFSLTPTARTTKGNYEQMQLHVNNFCQQEYGDPNPFADEMDLRFITRFGLWLRRQHVKNRNGAERAVYLAPTTVNKYLGKLIAVFHFATRMEVIDRFPFHSYENKLDNILKYSAEMLDRKVSKADLGMIENTNIGNRRLERVRLLFRFQRWTGMSWSDLNKFKKIENQIRTDPDQRRDVITYNRVKNGQLAIVPIFPETLVIMQRLGYDVGPGSYSAYYNGVRDLFGFFDLPVDDIGTHTGRHVFGSEMLEQGFSMESVSRMMGHASIEETQTVYAKVNEDKIFADYDHIKRNRGGSIRRVEGAEKAFVSSESEDQERPAGMEGIDRDADVPQVQQNPVG